jgi:hypothetical protein
MLRGGNFGPEAPVTVCLFWYWGSANRRFAGVSLHAGRPQLLTLINTKTITRH